MVRILCFGDSITFGIGEFPTSGWVGRIRELVSKKDYQDVYNLGVPGHTSSDLLKRFDIEADARIRSPSEERKYIMIIAIGTNDSKWDIVDGKEVERTLTSDFKKNIEILIDKAKSKKAELIVLGITPVDETETNPYEDTALRNERINEFNNIIKDACTNKDVVFIDFIDDWNQKPYTTYLDDGLHPNQEGYNQMAHTIYKLLMKNGLLE